MSSNVYHRFGLLYNPFKPLLAEERFRKDPKLLVVVGDKHRELLNYIKNTMINAINQKIFQGIILVGTRGSGKSCIVLRAIHELEEKNVQIEVLPHILRFPLGSFKEFIIELLLHLNSLIEEYGLRDLKGKIDEKKIRKERFSDAQLVRFFIDALKSIATVRKKPIILLIDQIESLREIVKNKDELNSFVNFLRNLSYLAGEIKNGVVVVLTCTPEAWDIFINAFRSGVNKEVLNYLREFAQKEVPQAISREDTKELFKVLLNIARSKQLQPSIEKKVKENIYYPFTEDAISYINAFAGGIPGIIYKLASELLDYYAGLSAIEIIDRDEVIAFKKKINKAWFKYAEKIYEKPIRELVYSLIKVSKRLGVINDVIRLRGPLKRNKNILQYIFNIDEKILSKLSADERKTLLDYSPFDLLIFYRHSNGIHKATLIKFVRKILKKNTVDCLIILLKNSTIMYAGEHIPVERVSLLIISDQKVSESIEEKLHEVSAITNLKNYEIIIIGYGDPYTYGRLLWLIDNINSINTTFGSVERADPSIREMLRGDIREFLGSIGILK